MKNFLICLLLIVFSACETAKKEKISFHFDKPARIWEETLPLGNGRIGLMPDGNIEKETLVMNEISLSSGMKHDTDNPLASESLSKIRELLFQGRNEDAQALMYSTFVCKGVGSNLGRGRNAPYGSYQILGNMYLDFQYSSADTVSNYKRELNIGDATSITSFSKGSTNYRREVFTSFTHDVGVIHLTADGNDQLNFSINLDRPERYEVSFADNDLIMSGYMNNGEGGNGMEYTSRVRVILPKNGNLSKTDKGLKVENASNAIVFVSMATDYFGEKPSDQVTTLINKAALVDYKDLLKKHSESYKEKFDRVSLDLGRNLEKENLPIDKRLDIYEKDKNDASLISLYFQYGRYLLLSSTREGLLPPNLQGLWCNTLDTPWNGDYHLDINLQMNLWPAEVTNLSELHMPMIEWVKSQVPSGQRTAKAFYNSSGWVTHVLGNLWEYTAPGEHPSWGATNTAAAWLSQHLFTHYLYSKDKEYLQDVYPTMKGAAQFFVDMLVRDPRNGYLITAPTSSPENGYYTAKGKVNHVSAGSTMDNQVIRELFTNVIKSSDILGIDKEFATLLQAKRDSLMPTTIARDGRVMEWLEEFKEVEPTHRHVSHLYGLYPGNEISVLKTPELAEAARKSLEGRGDESTGWSMAWKINFWARLHDGNRALKLLNDLLRPTETKYNKTGFWGGTYPNLFCAHPPFQIDGNFGSCAGIAEMLLQSQTDVIELLPALPDSWANGSVTGLKARGGFEVDIDWENMNLHKAKIKSLNGGECIIRTSKPIKIKDVSAKINKDDKGFYITSLDTKKNEIYHIISANE